MYLPSLSYATSEFLGPHFPDLTGVGDKVVTFGTYSLNNESNGANEIPRCPRAGGGTLGARNADGFIGGTLVARAALSFGPKHYRYRQLVNFPVVAITCNIKIFRWDGLFQLQRQYDN